MAGYASGFHGGSFNSKIIPQAGGWKGAPAGLLSLNKFDQSQENTLDSLLKHLQSGIGNVNLPGQTLQGNMPQNQAQQFNFAPIGAEAQRNFAQQTIPGLAERFGGMGSGGSLNSSAFGQALGGAGADLQSQLAALQSQYGQNQQQLNQGQQSLNQNEMGQQSNNLMNFLQHYLQQRSDQLYVPAQGSGAFQLAQAALPAIAQVAGKAAFGI